MKREDKKIIDDFELKARPVDMVNYIMMKEVIVLLKDIRKEMKEVK